MNNKQTKPFLVDEKLKQKLLDTLNPPKPDYWEPAKNTFSNFFNQYIIPYYQVILVIIVVALLFFYRYRDTKQKRMLQKLNNLDTKNYQYKLQNDTYQDVNKKESTDDEYFDINKILQYYNLQNELATEPQNNSHLMQTLSKKNNDHRSAFLSSSKSVHKYPSTFVKNNPKQVYPLYPYGTGSLLSPSSRK